MLSRICNGNGSVMPNEGKDGSMADYRRELPAQGLRVLQEDELLRSYRQEIESIEAESGSDETLSQCKWLPFAWNPPPRRSDRTRPIALHRMPWARRIRPYPWVIGRE